MNPQKLQNMLGQYQQWLADAQLNLAAALADAAAEKQRADKAEAKLEEMESGDGGHPAQTS